MLQEVRHRLRGLAWLAIVLLRASSRIAVDKARMLEERGRRGRLPRP